MFQAKLTRIDATGKAGDVSTDEDLGPAFATGALATNGQTIGYLLRSGEHNLEFRVKGGATTVIMDNDVPAGDLPVVLFSGRGFLFKDAQGRPAGGTQAMYYPMELHRGSVLFGGGGLKGGRVIGASESRGGRVRERPVTPLDLLATLYQTLGIPLDTHFEDATGRPVSIVGSGKPIQELF